MKTKQLLLELDASLEKQIMIIWAGTQGYLDDLPIDQCRKFEEELYRFVENAHRGVFEEIAAKKALDQAASRVVRSPRRSACRSP